MPSVPSPAASQAPVVRLRGLGFAYPGDAPLFVGLDADVPAGVTWLRGDTGTGKTTLLKLLAGELEARGEVVLLGRPLGADAAADRRDVCGFDPHDEAFDPLTPAALMAVSQARHPGFDAAACERHLAGFGLAPHLGKTMFMLSTGTRRKAGLAVALAAGSALTLLDEPAAGLDAVSLRYLAQVLADGASSPRAVLIACGRELDAVPAAATINLDRARSRP